MSIEDLKKQRAELDAKIKAMQELDKPPFKKRATYFYAGPLGAEPNGWAGDEFDVGAYRLGLAKKTAEEADAYIAQREATVRVNRAIERMNKEQGWEADWGDEDQDKRFIEYDYEESRLAHVGHTIYRPASLFLPMSRETVMAVIESHEADILCAMGVVK